VKFLQSIGALLVVGALLVFGYHEITSWSLDHRLGTAERRVEEVARESQEQKTAITKHESVIETHAETLREQKKEVTDLEKRVAAAEVRIEELGKESASVRKNLDDLLAAIEVLKERAAGEEKRAKALEDLSRELKKSLKRDTELERRLQLVEKQLGLERPQP